MMYPEAKSPPSTRFFSCRTAAFIVLAITTTFASDTDAAEPNLIVMMADDLGFGDLGCYDGWIKTPHLDALAASGVRLTDFHSSGNVCSPTRAGLLTGRYQQRANISGVVYADPSRDVHYHGLQDQERTFAELLGEAGYRTGMFGKWHLGYYPRYNPIYHGFDEYRGYVSGNVDFFTHVDQAGNADWWIDGRLENEEGYTTELITKHGLDFIDRNAEHPFCLYLPHEAPHYPYQGPNDEPQRSVGNPQRIKQSDAEIKTAYREMVQAMDDGVGQIIERLERHGLREQTLVIFLSDNGANRNGSNGPLRGFKGSNWEGGHRVPCIVSWPGTIPAAQELDTLAISLDVMPTLLAAAGVRPPQDLEFDGINLLPLLTGAEQPAPRQLYWNGMAMRDGHWKLMLTKNRNKETAQLFDLSNDLGETRDLAADMEGRVSEMRHALTAWSRDVASDATPQPDILPSQREEETRDWSSLIFRPENLVAWCIVPFDAQQRTPTERAEMVRQLGLRRVAYDWRTEHVPQFEEEIRQYQRNNIDFFAFWDWHDSLAPLIRKYDIHPQLWKTNPSPQAATDQAKVDRAVEQLMPLVEKARQLECKFGLYNHGGWGGEPRNLIAVCKAFRDRHDAPHVGIVYNFHHGHDDIANFATKLDAMLPYLLCINLNGMASPQAVADQADNKILAIGRGTYERQMIQTIADSGYAGPIGIIGHQADRDVEQCLQENLQGLKMITEAIE